MTNRKSIHTILLFTILGVSVSFGQWQVYDCSVLPAEADTAWHEYGDNEDGIPELISLVDDTAIIGNKLIKVDENQGAAAEVWRLAWNSETNVGATLVFRGVDLAPGTYERGFDIYVQNGLVRERFVSKGGKSIDLNKSGASVSLNSAAWHIYRITVIADFFEVYVDEEKIPYLNATGDFDSPGNYIQFGDNGKSTIGCLYDWFIWDVSGAYPPGQGTPIPQELLDTGSTDVIVKDLTKPNGFQLSQNYPNPFNPSTKITFSLKTKGHTTLTVYNTIGQLVATLVDETMGTGTYHATFDARELPSGVYFYQIKSDEFAQVKKMMLMK